MEARRIPPMETTGSMNNNFNLRDFLFKDRPGEDPGQRAETLVTTLFGFISTSLAIFAYNHPLVINASIITNGVAILVLVQALRGYYNNLIWFPAVTSVAVCLVAVVEGAGTHDLIWMGNLGLFLLANIYSRRNILRAILLGVFMIILFFGTGVAEVNGLLSNPYATDMKYVYLNTFFFVMIMGAIMVVFQRHQVLTRAANENKLEYIKANQRLERINQTLESQVQARTMELNKAGKQLQLKTMRLHAVAEISQEITSYITEKSDDILALIAHEISKKLGFYHVGIFLLDESREYAVLRAANSTGGKQMLARRHQLRVGGTGIVGYVAQSGFPRIALDTGTDAVFFNNPDLPETRSELSLPLKYGNLVIGVLDVQSTESSAFNDEDMDTLSTLANQVAVIITNMQTREKLYGVSPSSTRQSVQFSRKEKQSGYSFRPDGSIVSDSLPWSSPALEKTIASGDTVVLNPASPGTPSTLAVPVRFREQVIGVIHVESANSSRTWTEDEIAMVQAIADRAALALENARLLEDATRRANQEETVAHVTTKIGASSDFDRILQTTVQELGRALGASRSFIQIGTSDAEGGRGS
jgi:GAF domain-containing protein